jgi:hypothetical protein
MKQAIRMIVFFGRTLVSLMILPTYERINKLTAYSDYDLWC